MTRSTSCIATSTVGAMARRPSSPSAMHSVLLARPITITSILLAIGLGMGALGELNSTMEFSLMAAATVAIAWLLDVVVMPALLLRGLRSGQGHAIRSSRLDHAA
jgi:hypothetical protein